MLPIDVHELGVRHRRLSRARLQRLEVGPGRRLLGVGLWPRVRAPGCGRPRTLQPAWRNDQELAAATPVSVSYPVEREITKYADFTGRLQAVYSVEIRARVTGYLDRVYFKDGDEVNEGTSLFEFDPRPYKVDLDRCERSR